MSVRYAGEEYDTARALVLLDARIAGLGDLSLRGRGLLDAPTLLQQADAFDVELMETRILCEAIATEVRAEFEKRAPAFGAPAPEPHLLAARRDLWRWEALITVRAMRLERAAGEFAEDAALLAAALP